VSESEQAKAALDNLKKKVHIYLVIMMLRMPIHLKAILTMHLIPLHKVPYNSLSILKSFLMKLKLQEQSIIILPITQIALVAKVIKFMKIHLATL
jgi:hypothetical protein